jgi:zinc/manganese transport system permease protein
MIDLLTSPLLLPPLMTGLILAPLLAILGTWLRLRGEWLSALAWSQIAAAAGVAAAILQWPMMLTALMTTAIAAQLKALWSAQGSDAIPLLFLLGWGVALLLAANSSHGEMVGRAVIEGQLYFATPATMALSIAVALLALPLLSLLEPRLLLTRFYPDHFVANRRRAWPHEIGFSLIAVVIITLATLAMGVMAAFALIFIPPWIAFHLAVGWRQVVIWSSALALAAYLLAFTLALLFDQPFAPIMVLSLLLLTPLRYWQRSPKTA